MGVFWDAVSKMRENGRPITKSTAAKETAVPVKAVASSKKGASKPKKSVAKETVEEVKPCPTEATEAVETAVIANVDGKSR